MAIQQSNLSARFWSKVDRGDAAACWIWRAAFGTSGYGSIRIKGRNVTASRAAYEIANSVRLDPNQCVLHSCDNRKCVNPSHLRIGTKKDNAIDRHVRGRDWQSSVTHCPQGHEYTPANTRMYLGRRSCKECGRIAARELWRRKNPSSKRRK